MIKPTVQYEAKQQRFREEDPPRETIRVRIDPQMHEIVFTPDMLKFDGPMRPEEQMRLAMVEMLRGQACVAYETVMSAGLTAIAGVPTTMADVGVVMSLYVEEAAKRVEAAEKRADSLQALADRRKIEIETLERVLRRDT